VAVNQASSESNGTLTDHGDGSYTYVFKTNISNITKPVGGTAVTYDRHLTHRISLMMGGHSGPTDDDTFDFVPDGSPVTETRNIVATSGCKGCHGNEFHGHGGNRVSVENCVTCHNPSNTDAQSGNTLDMKVMIHKIHSGGELPSVTGPATDGILWDDPTTLADETADNDTFAIWGYGPRTPGGRWLPGSIQNTWCHQAGAQTKLTGRQNYHVPLAVPPRQRQFATGVGQRVLAAAVQSNDNFASTCHQEWRQRYWHSA
jgi:OmcA/MtrC family decaheme c-type cytochrome